MHHHRQGATPWHTLALESIAIPSFSLTDRPLRPTLRVARWLLVGVVVHMVEKSKSLFRDALVGFLFGLLVLSGIAVATWSSRTTSSQTR